MRRRTLPFAVVLVVGLLATPPANADVHLGLTTPPTGSTAFACSSIPAGVAVAQYTDDPSSRYIVPSPGGQVAAWSVNTTGATAGQPVTLLALRPLGGGSYQVVGVDSKTMPTPLPAGNVASFSVTSPINVHAGDTFGIYSTAGLACYWSGGTVPVGDSLVGLIVSSAPAVGQTLTPVGPPSPGSFTMNLAVTLSTNEDASVTAGSMPAQPTTGNLAVLTATIANHGPAGGPITFTDNVPAGLTINSATVANGTCSITGQTVRCTIANLASGQSAPANVVVTPAAPGSYTNHVSVAVSSGLIDPNHANDSATSVLRVGPKPVSPKCVVPKLGRTPGGVAKRVLQLLGCRVKLTHTASKHVPKGLVVGTRPGAGTYAVGKQVTLVISSGAPKHKKKKHQK